MGARKYDGRGRIPGTVMGVGAGGGHASTKLQKRFDAMATARSLNAHALAEGQVVQKLKMNPRNRALEPDAAGRGSKRRSRDDDDAGEDDLDGFDDEGEQVEDRGVQVRSSKIRARGADFLEGSDSEGNEWHEGVDGVEDDSEIESDDAFGESDEEMLDDFVFRGNNKGSHKKRAGDDEDDSGGDEAADEDDDMASLDSDAIELITALDQNSHDEPEEEEGGWVSSSEAYDDDSKDGDDEDDNDPDKLKTLQGLIASFGGEDNEENAEFAPRQKPNVTLEDLTLKGTGVDDDDIKKSLKIMKKEKEGTRRSRKLAVPLPRRQQEKLERQAAFEKTAETLNRWTDTVAQNRQSDHLVFPLAQNAPPLGTEELMPLTKESASTELEHIILAIMEESGLGPTAETEKKAKQEARAQGQQKGLVSVAQMRQKLGEKRRQREVQDREAERAKRIKKIKSKTYRRIHRKENLKQAEKEHARMVEEGLVDPEEEREAGDRRRAMERMGSRHKESKWSKLGSKAGRAKWDPDFQASLKEMAARHEELTRRVEGRTETDSENDSDDSDASAKNEEQERNKLLEQLDKAAAYDADEPKSTVRRLKFMQRAEEARKRETDELVKQLRKELQHPGEDELNSENEMQPARRQYGAKPSADAGARRIKDTAAAGGNATRPDKTRANPFSLPAPDSSTTTKLYDTWSGSKESSSKDGGRWTASHENGDGWSAGKKHGSEKAQPSDPSAVILDADDMLALGPATSAPPETEGTTEASTMATKKPLIESADHDADSESDTDTATKSRFDFAIATDQQALVARAFAADNVAANFVAEKHVLEEEEDEQYTDTRLPGWGNWGGPGVRKKTIKKNKDMRNNKRTKIRAGVSRALRSDAHLGDKVALAQRRVRKNDKYRADALPHVFENALQYEATLRMPIGPEWVTNETFAAATKPRVIVKQGTVIEPMTKPMV